MISNLYEVPLNRGNKFVAYYVPVLILYIERLSSIQKRMDWARVYDRQLRHSNLDRSLFDIFAATQDTVLCQMNLRAYCIATVSLAVKPLRLQWVWSRMDTIAAPTTMDHHIARLRQNAMWAMQDCGWDIPPFPLLWVEPLTWRNGHWYRCALHRRIL